MNLALTLPYPMHSACRHDIQRPQKRNFKVESNFLTFINIIIVRFLYTLFRTLLMPLIVDTASHVEPVNQNQHLRNSNIAYAAELYAAKFVPILV